MALELLQDDAQFTVRDDELPGVLDGDPEVTYTLRKLTQTKHREIVKRHTTSRFERGVGRVEEADPIAVMDDVLDHVLDAWTGVHLNGEPAPCAKALKVAGLDFPRKSALIGLAGMNDVAGAAERRAASFRRPA